MAASAAIKAMVLPDGKIHPTAMSSRRLPAKDAVIAAGGIERMLALVDAIEPQQVLVVEDTMVALAGLAACEAGADVITRSGGIPLFVKLLPGQLALPAATSLCSLVTRSPQRRAAVVRAGGVEALASLLRDGVGAEVQRCVLVALSKLAKDEGLRLEPWVVRAVATYGPRCFVDEAGEAGDSSDAASSGGGGQQAEGGAGSSSGRQQAEEGAAGSSNGVQQGAAAPSSGKQGAGGTVRAPEPLRCVACGSRESLMRCSGCRRVTYCGTACQLAHWRQHKKACRPAAAKVQGCDL